MPAYWVARSKINDPVEYKKYTDLVPAIIARHGGKVLARGGRHEILEGPHKFHRFVVIEIFDARSVVRRVRRHIILKRYRNVDHFARHPQVSLHSPTA